VLEFRNVPIVPFTELVAVHQSGSIFHRGGPIWPDFGSQVHARHCRQGIPVDTEPVPKLDGASSERRPLAWAGPIVPHFGHQLAEFSMRLWPTLRVWPDALMAFGVHTKSAYRSVQHTPRFFREVLSWFGVPDDRVSIVADPRIASHVFVAPQAEQIGGPAPQVDYLDSLEELATRRLGKCQRSGFAYVSRAGMGVRFAGEEYLERALASAGARIIRPELLSLKIQLRAYLSAEHLIFAEGSALHGAQLLGRSLEDVTVLVRMRGVRVAEASLAPRARSLRYIDATSGVLNGLWPSGNTAHDVGMPVLLESAVLDAFDRLGLPIRATWRTADFLSARNADIERWLLSELARTTPPGSHDVLAQSMANAGVEWPSRANQLIGRRLNATRLSRRRSGA
jgi:hypothetical protein